LNRVLVGGAAGHDPATFEQLASRHNAKIIVRFKALGAYLLELPTGTPESLIATLGVLSRDSSVAFALPDFIIAGSDHPIDTASLGDDDKKAYSAIGIEPAWRALEKHLLLPSPVTMAIIDTALDLSAGGQDFDSSNLVALEMIEKLPKSFNLAERAEHGTAVASVTAAANNGRGLSGILTSVPNLPYRVLFYQTAVLYSILGIPLKWDIYTAGVFASLDDILTKSGQVDVVNMSFRICPGLGLRGDAKTLAELCAEEGPKFSAKLNDMANVVFIAAAGNQDTDAERTFPANLSGRDNLMAVGATHGHERSIWDASKHSASNYGLKITLAAPGTDVWVVNTLGSSGSAKGKGTSFSAPIVAGVTGLVRSISPDLKPKAIKELLRETGQKISICAVSSAPCPTGKQEEWRLLQADKAIDKALRDAGLLYERVALVGTVPGQFTTTEAIFTLSVSPRDEAGRLIESGISESNFSFRDVTASSTNNPGVIVTRSSVKVVDVDVLGTRTPTERTVILLFDSSGSMSNNDPDRLRVEAGVKLIGLLKGADRAAILDFGAGADSGRRAARLLADLTTDTAALKTGVERVTQSGRTPLFDGLLDAMDVIVKNAAANPAIVVLTDGEENASSSGSGQVVERGRQLKIPIFAIGLGSAVKAAQLEALARETGGTYAAATDAEGLTGVFRTIGLGIVEGRTVVTGQGTFVPPIPSAGAYLISGKLDTKLGRETFETPFNFVVEVQLPTTRTSTVINIKVKRMPTGREDCTQTATGPVQLLDLEKEYLPIVVASENGAAGVPLEALKAQAVASRSFAIYKMQYEPRSAVFDVCDTTADQKYNPLKFVRPEVRRAVQETAGIVAKWNGEIVAGLFVKGDQASGTAPFVTVNEGKRGNDVTPASRPRGAPENPHNRGIMGQDKTNELAKQGWDYQRILRYFYGADVVFSP
jgi:Mg-chelatase subunit ChlD